MISRLSRFSEHQKGAGGDGSNASDNQDRRDDIDDDQPARGAPGAVLRVEEIHALSGERDVRNLALLFGLDLKEASQLKAEHPGDDVVGKVFGLVIIGEHSIIEGLTRKGDLILGTRELLLELHHILIRFQIRISFREGKKTSERASKQPLGRTEFHYRIAVGWICFGGFETRYSCIAGIDDGFECFALMLHVAFNGFDEVGDQVIATGQLHVDLREGVLDAIAKIDEGIVDKNCKEDYRDNYREEY